MRLNGGVVLFVFDNDNDVQGFGSDGLLRDRVFYGNDSTCGEGWSGCDPGLGERIHLNLEYDPVHWGGASVGVDYGMGVIGSDGDPDVFKNEKSLTLDPGLHFRLPSRLGVDLDVPFSVWGSHAAASWGVHARVSRNFGL